MANERRLANVNGSFTIGASDNTDYNLCFGGGLISVIDKYGHIICEFFSSDVPTVDVIIPVRCEDCRFAHRIDGTKEEYSCAKAYYFTPWFNPDDYCSRGERNSGTQPLREDV